MGVAERPRPGVHRVDDAEHGRVHADPERQDQHREQREPPVARESPDGVPRVARELIRQPQAPRVPTLVLDLLDATEGAKRRPPGLLVRHASRDMLRTLTFEMKAKLLVELVLTAPPEHERPHLRHNQIHDSHDRCRVPRRRSD